MPDPRSPMEDASLYVLDLLDPESKQAFESELARSAELRWHVAELRTAFDALALAAPPAAPPVRVWHAIANRTADLSPRSSSANSRSSSWQLTLARLVRTALSNGWAVAALLTIAFVAHLLREPSLGSGTHRELAAGTPRNLRSPGSSRPLVTGNSGGQGTTGHVLDPETTLAARPRATNRATATAAATEDTARLRDRVRSLSEQVAMLTRVLTQQNLLPPGSSRLQVFRLVSTNGVSDALERAPLDPHRLASATPDPTPVVATPETASNPPTASVAGPDLSLALALAAARQFASQPTARTSPDVVTTDPTTGLITLDRTVTDTLSRSPSSLVAAPVETPAVVPTEPVLAPDPIQVVDLSQPAAPTAPASEAGLVSTSDNSAYGAFSTETGTGAIAFRVPTDTAEPSVLQLWITDGHSGTVQSLGFTSVGGTVATPQVMVLKFAVDANAWSSPTFLITREPVGGSSQPSGPVVALPPPITPLPPAP